MTKALAAGRAVVRASDPTTARAASSGGEPPESRPSRSRRDGLVLAGLVALAAALYAAFSLLRFRAFQAGTYDLVIFDQAIRSYSGFGAPVAMVKGVHNGFGPDFSILGDHFSPLLALLAPLYWIHDGPATLLVAQAVLFALAIVPIWRYARRRLGRASAYLVAGAYALSWPIAEAVAFDFHEVAFVPFLTALLIERYDAGRRGQAALAATALLLVKEDAGLLLAGLGFVLLTRRGERIVGGACVAAGIAATWISSRVMIAAFGGDNAYYWAYGSLGEDMPSAALHILTHPWAVPAALGSPSVKLVTVALLVLPLLLLPLRSPLSLAVLPMLAERMLADQFPNWWEPKYHYNAFLIAILVMAAVDGAYRLRRSRLLRRAGTALGRAAAGRLGAELPAAALFTAAVAALPFFAFGDLADPGLYRLDERARAAAAAVSVVPDGALVETVNNLGPALSGRTKVLLWDREPRRAPWVVADTARFSFPFRSLAEQRERVGELIDGGYRPVFRRTGYVVLTRD
ncbi:DUF2079 domain-containing protein [Actinomadura sp. 9N407]|uniref:DUF2079 domain-containing protein n=1 Tax=Actinomadura sp. 9N407 TaxID=3375154 RepID=UPI0037A59D1E